MSMEIASFAVAAGIYLFLVLWSAVVVSQAFGEEELKIRHLVLIIFPPVLLLLIIGSLVWHVMEGLGTRLAAIVKRGW